MSENTRKKSLQRHIVECPHCGKEVLDHMTVCVHCNGKLVPKGYSPMMDDETKKKVRFIVGAVLAVLAVVIFLSMRLF